MEGTYRAVTFCCNCRSRMEFEVPRGTKKRDWIDKESLECPNCGCQVRERT